MAISSSSGILGQYEANQALTADRVSTDKDTFLKLLVAQLTNQDPLNPVEDTEFIAQLAQFTQVEELQKISAGMDQLNASYLQSQIASAASLISANVSASGDMVTLVDGRDISSYIYAEIPYAAASVIMNVYAADSDGNPTSMVASYSLGAHNAGTYKYDWDGYGFNGERCANGTYIVVFSAVDEGGNQMLVNTSSIGQVIGLTVSEDGNHYLHLEDGRTVRFNDVDIISGVFSSGGGGGDGEGDGEEGGEGDDGGTGDGGAGDGGDAGDGDEG